MNRKVLFLGLAVVAVGFFVSRRGGISLTSGNTFNENASVPIPALAGGTALNTSASPQALSGGIAQALSQVAASPSPTALLPPPQTYSPAPAPAPVDQRKTAQPVYRPAIEPLDYSPVIDWSTIGGA